MERIKPVALFIWVWLIARPAVWIYQATFWLLKVSWRATKLVGRFSMWILFWPVAMLRANKKSRAKETDRLLAALEAQAAGRK